MTERCEYNPIMLTLSHDPPAEGDCPNDATLCVGAYGEWHLCDSCAKLEEFKRFKSRAPLKTARAAERK